MKHHSLFFFLFLSTLLSFSQKKVVDFESIGSSINYKGDLYFSAQIEGYGYELWRTDGTEDGTELVKDISPGPGSSNPDRFFVVDNNLYFMASTGSLGRELWVTDGSATGTRNLLDLASGTRNFLLSQWLVYKENLIVVGDNRAYLIDLKTLEDECLLSYCYSGISGKLFVRNEELYLHNTYNGFLAKFIDDTSEFIPFNFNGFDQLKVSYIDENEIYLFSGRDYGGVQKMGKFSFDTQTFDSLASWTTDTYGSIEIGDQLATGGLLYFSVRIYPDSGEPTDALWVTDGTTSGTLEVRSTSWSPHTYESELLNFISYNNKLYYISNEVDGSSLWVSDGTPSGTHKVNDTYIAKYGRDGDNDIRMTLWKDELYFQTSGRYLAIMNMEHPEELYVYRDDLDGLQFLSSTDNHFFFKTEGDFYNESLWISDPSGKIVVQEQLNFGDVDTNGCKEMSIQIANVGRDELYIGNLEVSGDYFYIESDFSGIIPVSGSMSGTLSFFPAQSGYFNGALHVLSSDPSSIGSKTVLTGSSTILSSDSLSCFDQISPLRKTLNLSLSDSSSIKLSVHQIDENKPSGSEIGRLSFNGSDEVSYAFVQGEGDAHNHLFQIENDQLLTNTVFDYEQQTTYGIRVQASDGIVSDTGILFISVVDLFEQITPSEGCEETFKTGASPLNDVAILDNGRVVAVGVGEVLLSDDNGYSWRNLNLPLISSYDKLKFFDDIGYAIGANGILKTMDQGENWKLLSLGMNETRILGGDFVNDTLGYVIDLDSKLRRTQNGGDSWIALSKIPVDEISSLKFQSDSIGYLGTEMGILYQTSDGGISWKEMSRVGVESVKGITEIEVLDDAIYYNSYGGSYISSNGGGSWSLLVSSDYYNEVTGVQMTTSTEGYMYRSGQGLYKTTDAGKNWSLAFSARGEIESIDIKDGLIIGVGRSEDTYSNNYPFKMIIRGEDSSFELISYINTRYFSGFSGPNKVNTDGPIMIVYGEGSIALSTDYGLTFKDASLSAPYFNDAVFYDELNGLATTSLTSFRTTDGGFNWEEMVDAPAMSKFCYVSKDVVLGHIFDPEGDGENRMYRSEDAGITWERYFPEGFEEVPYPAEWKFLTPTFGVLHDNYRIYITQDGGAHWQLINTGSSFSKIDIVNEQLINLVSYDGRITRTVDGGQNWFDVPRNDISLELDMVFFTENWGFGVDRSYVYETLDGGTNWEVISSSHYDVDHIHKDSEGNLYLTGRDGAFFTYKPTIPIFAFNISGDHRVIPTYPYTYSVNLASTRTSIAGWTIEGGTIAGFSENGVMVKWDSTSSVHQIAVDMSGCGESTSIVKIIQLTKERSRSQIEEEEEEEEEETLLNSDLKNLSIYPNPTSDYITIPGEHNFLNVQITSTDGKLVQSLAFYKAKGEIQISVSKLPSGVYILNAWSDTDRFHSKFIKE